MGITIEAGGSFINTQKMLQRMAKQDIRNLLEKYGSMGVQALKDATPVSTGETAGSWIYEVRQSRGVTEIVWSNTHNVNGANIAILIQYGHGTGTGGYIQGRDYINPAMRPIFEKILEDIRRVVKA